MSSSTDLIPLKNSLKSLSDLALLKQMVVSKIQSLPNYETLKNDVELVLFACNVLENAHKDLKGTKLNKRQLIVLVFAEIFNLDDQEKLTVSNTVQFLFDHSKIKQVKIVLVVGNVIINWFLKKFACFVYDTIKTELPLINILIIKKEIIIVSILNKVGVSKLVIPLILLFL